MRGEKKDRRVKRLTRYFSMAEARRLIGRCRRLERRTAMIVGWTTGSRVGEGLTMRLEHWNEARGVVELIDSKKPGLVRKVPFPVEALVAIQTYADERGLAPRDLLFEVDPKTLTRWVKAQAREAAIEWDRRTENVRWHSWRGTFVRYWVDQPGVREKDLVDWTGDSAETLSRYYLERSERDQVELIRKLATPMW